MNTECRDPFEIVKKDRGHEIGLALGFHEYGHEVNRILSAKEAEECHLIRKKLPPGSRPERLAVEKVQQIISSKLEKATTLKEIKEVYNNPFSDEETRLEAFKKTLSFMTASEIRKEIFDGTYSNNVIHKYLAVERHDEMILNESSYSTDAGKCMGLSKQVFKRSTKNRLFKKAMTIAGNNVDLLQKVLGKTDRYSEHSYICIKKIESLRLEKTPA